jgi:HK97 family phage major capsid protein
MNITLLQTELRAKQAQALSLFEKHAQLAETENRVTTDDEREAVQALVTEADGIRAKIARASGDSEQLAAIQRLSQGIGLQPVTPTTTSMSTRKMTMGQQFVHSTEYEFFKKGQHRVQSAWRSPSVELFDRMRGTTLTEDPASGGALIVPQYLPGIVPLGFQPIVVADLFAQGTTTSNLIIYMKETTFTNAAATTAEGAAKPESALIFSPVQDPVRKVAHFLPVSEEMLEDSDQIQSYIDARLRLGVDLAEENSLLNGDGIAPHILGVLNRPGIAPPYPVTAPDNNADAIYKQMMTIAWTSFLMPDGIVMNPSDWAGTVLIKTTQGAYLTAGPFAALQAPTLWGLPVALSPSIVKGTALVGAFKAAGQLFTRGGMRVEASNSHLDFFIKNLVAIRAEERIALCIYRPGAFGTVTGLTDFPSIP